MYGNVPLTIEFVKVLAWCTFQSECKCTIPADNMIGTIDALLLFCVPGHFSNATCAQSTSTIRLGYGRWGWILPVEGRGWVVTAYNNNIMGYHAILVCFGGVGRWNDQMG